MMDRNEMLKRADALDALAKALERMPEGARIARDYLRDGNAEQAANIVQTLHAALGQAQDMLKRIYGAEEGR